MRVHFAYICLFAAAFPISADAEIPCPSMPDSPTTITRDVQADIGVQVGRLGPIKAGELSVKTNVAARSVFDKYPNIDRLVALRTMAATYCVMLQEDNELTKTEKLKRWETFQLKVLNLNAGTESPKSNRAARSARKPQDVQTLKKTPPNDDQQPKGDEGAGVETEWGAITTSNALFNARQIGLLTNYAPDLGPVSGKANDPSGTGVVFRGHIHQSTGTGEIQFFVWDSVAAQKATPVTWKMAVVQVSSVPSENGAEVFLQSGNSVFRFNGDFDAPLWTGTVELVDLRSGKRTHIGNFSIIGCKILDCPDDPSS